MKPDALYGVLAEFRTADALLEAARAAKAAGYRDVEAYTPFPVEGLDQALAIPPNRVPLAALVGGIAGGAGTYFLQWYSAVIDYPVNIGGRPLHSWPSYIPATFEITILGAALAAVAAMLIMNGLPRLTHPLFAVPEFDLATRNRFFLCVRARGPRFDAERARAFIATLDPLCLCDVPA
ncbi:MAG TPA: DUF3341 domain-containing protein [Burkholderiales bacterium]|nr:DUF3341 domain-containing protein [Burkholderiales bacterium]